MIYFVKFILMVIGINGVFNFNGVEVPIVTGGDGLYFMDNGFVFRGKNSNNYIKFNNEIWRIISIDSNKIRIIKNSSICNIPFDFNDINVWEKSNLKKYLNEYISFENRDLLKSDIEIIDMAEFISSNSNFKDCGDMDLYFANYEKCFSSSYMNFLNFENESHAAWTKSIDDGGTNSVYYFGNVYFGDGHPSDSGIGVFPVVNLKRDIELSGYGTLQKPYIIEK